MQFCSSGSICSTTIGKVIKTWMPSHGTYDLLLGKELGGLRFLPAKDCLFFHSSWANQVWYLGSIWHNLPQLTNASVICGHMKNLGLQWNSIHSSCIQPGSEGYLPIQLDMRIICQNRAIVSWESREVIWWPLKEVAWYTLLDALETIWHSQSHPRKPY
jgi:hypothetical protein